MNQELTAEDWTDKIAPYHFADEWAEPIRLIWGSWEASLEALLETLKCARLAPLHEVLASAFLGQLLCESGMGKHQECLLGEKATASDIAACNFIRIPTLELLDDQGVAGIQVAGDFIAFTGRQSKDGSRKEIRCYQKFYHPQDARQVIPGDWDRWLHFYEAHKPNRAQFLQAGTAEFLRNVTCSSPYAYATGEDYVKSIMELVDELKLDELNLSTV